MRSLSAIGRVAAVGALIAAVVLVGSGPLRQRRRRRLQGPRALPERRSAREGQPRAGGRGAGGLREGHQDHGRRARRYRALDRRGPLTPAAGHARGDPPVLPVGSRQPLRRPEAPAGHGQHDPGRRRHRYRQHRHPGRPRRALQHARSRDAQVAPGLLPALGRPVARQGARGQRRLPVPEPGAVHLEPALQRADQGHPGARALPRGQLADGDRPRGPPRRPCEPDRQPQHHNARARQPEGGARRVDRPSPAVHAPCQHDVCGSALHPQRGRPARGGVEAGGEAPAALPLAGSGLRRGRRADGARPQHHDPQAGRLERPDQPPALLPAAGRDRHGHEAARLRARWPQPSTWARRAAPSRSPSTPSRAEPARSALPARTPPTSSAGSTTSRPPAVASTRSVQPLAA